MWSDAERDPAAIAWGRSSWEELSKYGNGRVFLNFTGRAGESLQSGTDAMFGPNAKPVEGVGDPAHRPQRQRRLSAPVSARPGSRQSGRGKWQV